MARRDLRSAPTHALRHGVHAVAIDEDLVFMDERADSYLCLPLGAAAVHLVGEGHLTISVPELARELQAARLIVPYAGRSAEPRPLPKLPTRTLEPPLSSFPSLGDAQLALRAVADVMLNYRGKPLSSLLATARRAPVRSEGLCPEIVELVRRFHSWIPYAPLPGKCLVRSFTLLRLLQCRGFGAHWVFGVRTWPFAAHCWLQIDDVVLDDHHDRLAAFHPILAV